MGAILTMKRWAYLSGMGGAIIVSRIGDGSIITKGIFCQSRIPPIHVSGTAVLLQQSTLLKILYLTANDISKGSYAVQKVRTTFAGAHGILTATAYLRAGMMRSQQNGQYFDMRSFYNSEDASILASILGITQEVRDLLIYMIYR